MDGVNPNDAAMRAAADAARTGYGRLLAILASRTADVAAAEDSLAGALEQALRTWPERGVPDHPDAWLLTVSRNRLRDHWKSAVVNRTVPLDDQAHAPVHVDDLDPDAIPDHRLELMLVCAHPAIAPAARTPLMLNTVLGFTAEQIARSFVVPTATMATRLVRAKNRIKANRIPFALPDRHALPERMNAVLEAVYGAYAIEHTRTGGERRRTPSEGLQLAEILAEVAPDDPEAHGLAALVGLSVGRRASRVDDDGNIVPLAEQDPRQWDDEMIEHARHHLRRAHRVGVLGRFQVEAAIQAVHCARRETGTTNWASLRDLHQVLTRIAPTLGNATALAAVTGELNGPEAGLAVLAGLGERADAYQPAWATRAHLLARAGRLPEAAVAYDQASRLTADPGERRYLRGRAEELC